jgi:hypothetical protein
MATHRVSIMGGLVPDTTGNAYFEPYSVAATNDVWKHEILRLKDAAADCGVYGGFTVPKNYVGTAKIVYVYTTTATSGSAYLGYNYRAVGGDDTESLDQSGTQESVTPAAAGAPSAAHERKEMSLSLASANLAVDDFVEFFAFRDNDNGSDNLAADVLIHDILFEFADA